MAWWVRILHVFLTLRALCGSPVLLGRLSEIQGRSEKSNSRRMQIKSKPCSVLMDQKEISGYCMFNFECYQKGGTVMGTCVDGFLFGACCHLPYVITSQETIKDPEYDTDMSILSNLLESQSTFLTTDSISGHLVTESDIFVPWTTDAPISNGASVNISDTRNKIMEKLLDNIKNNVKKITLNIPDYADQSITSTAEISSAFGLTDMFTEWTTKIPQDYNNVLVNDVVTDNRPRVTPKPIDIFAETDFDITQLLTGTPRSVTKKYNKVTFKPRPEMFFPETTTMPSTMADELLVWTLSPSPSIMDARPHPSLISQLKTTTENNLEDSLVTWILSTQSTINDSLPFYTSNSFETRQSTLPHFNHTRPLTLWTTEQPKSSLSNHFSTSSDLRTNQSTRPLPSEMAQTSSYIDFLDPIDLTGNLLQQLADDMSKFNLTGNDLASPSYSLQPITTDPYSKNSPAEQGLLFATQSSHNIETSTMEPYTTAFFTSQKPDISTDKFINSVPLLEKPLLSKNSTLSSSALDSPAIIEENLLDNGVDLQNLLHSIYDRITTPSDVSDVSAPPVTNITTGSHIDEEITIDLDLLIMLLNITHLVSKDDIVLTIPSTSNGPIKLNVPSLVQSKPSSLPSASTFPSTTATTTASTTPGTTTTSSTTTISTTTTLSTTTSTTTTTTTRKAWDWRTTCGVRPLMREGRIVNGERADFGEWPWQALVRESTWLGIFTKNKCGGVLLTEKYVITAAHCQPGFLASLIVVLGDYDLSGDYEPKRTVQRNVKRVVVHRGYVARTFDNDLALLELESPVKFDEHILPICLPETKEDYIGTYGHVTGWGRLSYGGPVPDQLNEVTVPVIPNDTCQKWFLEAGHMKKIKPEFICAGYKDGKMDSCEGDSGGPLSILGDDGRWILAGTVSHGIKCAYPNLPGVYMRMSYYKPWIESIIYS